MTAKIKLNAASGGGSFSLQAPSSSSNDRVMTLPDTANGTILTTTNPKVGNIIQVVSTTKTGTASMSSATFADISGMSVTLTPSSGSKVYVTCDLQIGSVDNSYAGFKVLRDSTAIGLGTEGTGNMSNVTFGTGLRGYFEYRVQGLGYHILDTHGADGSTAVTYKIQWASLFNTNTIYLNRPHTADNNAYNIFGSSTITAMEVAG